MTLNAEQLAQRGIRRFITGIGLGFFDAGTTGIIATVVDHFKIPVSPEFATIEASTVGLITLAVVSYAVSGGLDLRRAKRMRQGL